MALGMTMIDAKDEARHGNGAIESFLPLKPALVLPRVSKRLTIESFGGRGNKARLSISFPPE